MGCNWSGWPEGEVAESVTVRVEVPEGVTTGGGGVTAALPPPQPVRANVMQGMETAPQRTRQFLRAASWKVRRFLQKNATKRKNRARKAGTDAGTCEIGGMRSG